MVSPVDSAISDLRPRLQLAAESWARQDDEGRRILVSEAAKLGMRLEIAERDGAVWPVPVNPSDG